MMVDSDSTISEEEGEAPAVALPISLVEPEKILRCHSNSATPPRPIIPWSMVAIRDYGNHDNHENVVFPPINHENLQISTNSPPTPKEFPQIYSKSSIALSQRSDENSESDSFSDSDSHSSATFSPSDSSAVSPSPPLLSPKASSASHVALWFDSWVEILRSKVNYTLSVICRNLASVRMVSLTFTFRMAGMLLLFLYLWRRRGFTAQGNTTGQLMRVIKEKDEKINQLLDKIAAMNQAMIASHRAPSSSTT